MTGNFGQIGQEFWQLALALQPSSLDTHGKGNNIITVDGRHVYMTDANCCGLRLDYALASNLNIYLTIFLADRESHEWA